MPREFSKKKPTGVMAKNPSSVPGEIINGLATRAINQTAIDTRSGSRAPGGLAVTSFKEGISPVRTSPDQGR